MTNIVAIIPTHERNDLLMKTISCLKNQDISEDIKLEVIVVIDESKDAAENTKRKINNKFDDISTVLGNGEWWYTKCINVGFRRAEDFSPDYVLTLNDDVIFSKNFVHEMVRAENKLCGDAIIGAISLSHKTPRKITFSGVKEFIKWRIKEIHYMEKNKRVQEKQLTGLYTSKVLYGRGLLIPYKWIKTLNYYDERFVQYRSETDFTLRATKLGLKVYISYDAKVYENTKTTSKGTLKNNPPFIVYVLSHFDKYSVNSIQKATLYYWKHGLKIFTPLFVAFQILAIPILYFRNKYK